jgi:hypothetical protein
VLVKTAKDGQAVLKQGSSNRQVNIKKLDDSDGDDDDDELINNYDL